MFSKFYFNLQLDVYWEGVTLYNLVIVLSFRMKNDKKIKRKKTKKNRN